MKPFKINRNSWHYKLNKHFMNEDSWCMERSWEPKRSNFCSYWRATIIRCVAALVMATIIFGAVAFLIAVTIANPISTLLTIGGIIGFFATVIGFVALTEYMRSRKPSENPSIVVQKYRAYKSKICPSVEYHK
jgi:uncharacterized membrane protein